MLVASCSANRLMNSYELRPIRKRRFDLHIGNHFGYTLHHIAACEECCAIAHEVGDGSTVARSFKDGTRNERNRFRIVELEPACSASFGEQSGGEEQQLVFFSRC